MDLVERCMQHDWHRIAFIGATKHAGKTTAMNAFIEDAHAAGYRLALCSIGLDGERLDTILGVAKPPVFVPEGTLVASAEGALAHAEARFEYLADLGITSPLGNVMLVRTTSAGSVQLAGVRQRRHVEVIVPKLRALGADFCLVDGAFDRIAAAAPNLVDAAVFAVGAVAGPSVQDVVTTAASALQRFALPVVDNHLTQVLSAAVHAGQVGVWNASELKLLPAQQTVLGLRQHPSWSDNIEAVYVPGAVTDKLLDDLAAHPNPLHITAAHPAQVLASTRALRSWYRRGSTVSVWHELPLAAIAINPHSITGYDLPETSLFEQIQQIAADVPVYNAAKSRAGGHHG